MPGEDIGEYDGDYIDSQENFLYASHLSCEELEEGDFMEGDYANDEVKSLEEGTIKIRVSRFGHTN
jgi:hypothetical protein